MTVHDLIENAMLMADTPRDRMIAENMPLAVKLARDFARRFHREATDEELSDAMLGLIKAVDRFEPERGFAFSTFACHVVNNELYSHGKRRVRWASRYKQTDDSIDQPEPETDEAFHMDAANLWEGMSERVNDRELDMLRMRFDEGMTLHEIGERYGLVKERARQIIAAAMNKLRPLAGCEA